MKKFYGRKIFEVTSLQLEIANFELFTWSRIFKLNLGHSMLSTLVCQTGSDRDFSREHSPNGLYPFFDDQTRMKKYFKLTL